MNISYIPVMLDSSLLIEEDIFNFIPFVTKFAVVDGFGIMLLKGIKELSHGHFYFAMMIITEIEILGEHNFSSF